MSTSIHWTTNMYKIVVYFKEHQQNREKKNSKRKSEWLAVGVQLINFLLLLKRKSRRKFKRKKRVAKMTMNRKKIAVQIKVHIKSNSIRMNRVYIRISYTCHSSWTMNMTATATSKNKNTTPKLSFKYFTSSSLGARNERQLIHSDLFVHKMQVCVWKGDTKHSHYFYVATLSFFSSTSSREYIYILCIASFSSSHFASFYMIVFLLQVTQKNDIFFVL